MTDELKLHTEPDNVTVDHGYWLDHRIPPDAVSLAKEP